MCANGELRRGAAESWDGMVRLWRQVEALGAAIYGGSGTFGIEIRGPVYQGRFEIQDLLLRLKKRNGTRKLALPVQLCDVLLDDPGLFRGFEDSLNYLLPESNLQFGFAAACFRPDAAPYLLLTRRFIAAECREACDLLHGRLLTTALLDGMQKIQS